MKIHECEFCRPDADEARNVAARLLEQTASVEAFAQAWLQAPGASLDICTGYDDDDVHSLLCIIPKTNGEDVAHIYLLRTDVFERFPEVKVITSYLKGASTKILSEDLDEGLLDKRAAGLGLSYHDDLLQLVGAFPAVFQYMLSYALDDVGECTLEVIAADDDIFGEDFEDEDLLKKRLGWCHMGYRDPKTGLGFAENCYFILE